MTVLCGRRRSRSLTNRAGYARMRTAPPPPTRSDVEHRFEAVLEQSGSRDQVDRWAAQWVAANESGVTDEHVWWGLTKLNGIDLRHGPNAPYLHDDEQVADWLAEFRTRCADRA